ncbi:hypothetical protein [Marinobacterium lutimaris]|nr:hypothetical protein [Marinobacterium lutimaris]
MFSSLAATQPYRAKLLMHFQNLDVSVLLMYGRSTARQRVFAWAISVFLLVSLLVLFWYAPVIPDEDIANTVQAFGSFVLEGFGGAAVIVMVQRLLFPMKRTLTDQVRRFTPIGFIEERDRSVLDNAYIQVMETASRVDFRKALELAAYDPEILSFGNLRVIVQQRRGRLARWMVTEERISQACFLLYLCHRAEQKKRQITETGQTDIF